MGFCGFRSQDVAISEHVSNYSLVNYVSVRGEYFLVSL